MVSGEYGGIYCQRHKNLLKVQISIERILLLLPFQRRTTSTTEVHTFVALNYLSAIYLSVNLSICLHMYLSIYPSTQFSIHPPIHLSVCPSVHPSTHLSIYLSIDLSIDRSMYLLFHLRIESMLKNSVLIRTVLMS